MGNKSCGGFGGRILKKKRRRKTPFPRLVVLLLHLFKVPLVCLEQRDKLLVAPVLAVHGQGEGLRAHQGGFGRQVSANIISPPLHPCQWTKRGWLTSRRQKGRHSPQPPLEFKSKPPHPPPQIPLSPSLPFSLSLCLSLLPFQRRPPCPCRTGQSRRCRPAKRQSGRTWCRCSAPGGESGSPGPASASKSWEREGGRERGVVVSGRGQVSIAERGRGRGRRCDSPPKVGTATGKSIRGRTAPRESNKRGKKGGERHGGQETSPPPLLSLYTS